MRLRWTSVLLSIILFCGNAHAWLRMYVEDAILAARSELIVVGHIKKGSVTYVSHNKNENEGAGWEYHAMEYHATLVIAETVKGKLEEKELPITIHYGIDAIVGGKSLSSSHYGYFTAKNEKPAEDQIDLFDFGDSMTSFQPFIYHVEDDKLWFLCRREGEYGREIGKGERYGIADPEEVQPLDLKDLFLAYLAADPEAAVKKYVATHPGLAVRTKRYFEHCEVARILAIKDVEERAKKLFPYFLKWQYWHPQGCEARGGLVACGEVAGRLLVTAFNDPLVARNREEIMEVWGNMQYRPTVEELIKELESDDKFWGEQDLKGGGWWNGNVDSDPDLTEKRRNIYSKTYYTVFALNKLNDPRAKDAVELTAKRWRAMNFSNPQIVEECDRALKEWGPQK